MNRLFINLEHTLAALDPNGFGGFAEHLGQCIYGGIYDPESPLADERGLRTDVMEALRRLKMPGMRYPGGNFVSYLFSANTSRLVATNRSAITCSINSLKAIASSGSCAFIARIASRVRR